MMMCYASFFITTAALEILCIRHDKVFAYTPTSPTEDIFRVLSLYVLLLLKKRTLMLLGHLYQISTRRLAHRSHSFYQNFSVLLRSTNI